MFWEIDLLEASDELVAELLDHLHERLPDLQPVLDVRRLNDLPLQTPSLRSKNVWRPTGHGASVRLAQREV